MIRCSYRLLSRLVSAAGLAVLLTSLAWELCAADWPMHRGNAARTGAVDDEPGPANPKVLWVHKSKDQYIAAPVPGDGLLYVAALGPFNSARFEALDLAAEPKTRLRWGKGAPYLKLPAVSPPAVGEGLLVFGDGMHQTDGAVLHALNATTGLPVWQLPVPGKLVHLEGGPTIHDGRVYLGGGHAGLLCVDLKKVTLDGKELAVADAQALLLKRWQELVTKYEAEKKQDPDFAVPPSEDALPKPAPKLLWQQGAGMWHVDSACAVGGGKVVFGSAFLDLEKEGTRELVCLNAADGKKQWTTPLKLNPWAGVTLDGETAIVGCSSIRFEPKLASKGQGELVVVNLSDGSEVWKKPVPGGILSSVAVKNGLAICTATDGKVRAFDLANGRQRWSFTADAPFFAGPAVSGDLVCVCDLKGKAYGLKLTDGRPQWKLEYASDPAVQSAGMVYGSPVLKGGRLYVATCDLEGDGKKGTAVVCLGDK